MSQEITDYGVISWGGGQLWNYWSTKWGVKVMIDFWDDGLENSWYMIWENNWLVRWKVGRVFVWEGDELGNYYDSFWNNFWLINEQWAEKPLDIQGGKLRKHSGKIIKPERRRRRIEKEVTEIVLFCERTQNARDKLFSWFWRQDFFPWFLKRKEN